MTAVRVRILGEGEAARAGASLVRAGDGRLKRDLLRAIREATTGLQTEIRASAISHLPKRGGLARDVARSRILIRNVYAGGVGVSVTVRGPYNLTGLDQGRDIHPLFGNRRHWYLQRVRPGWFTDAVNGTEDRTRRLIDEVCDRFAASI